MRTFSLIFFSLILGLSLYEWYQQRKKEGKKLKPLRNLDGILYHPK
mgnify:CR=1 FL=1